MSITAAETNPNAHLAQLGVQVAEMADVIGLPPLGTEIGVYSGDPEAIGRLDTDAFMQFVHSVVPADYRRDAPAYRKQWEQPGVERAVAAALISLERDTDGAALSVELRSRVIDGWALAVVAQVQMDAELSRATGCTLRWGYAYDNAYDRQTGWTVHIGPDALPNITANPRIAAGLSGWLAAINAVLITAKETPVRVEKYQRRLAAA